MEKQIFMSNIRILCIEDDLLHAEQLITKLEVAGYEDVRHTQVPEEALSLVGSFDPDLVTMDVGLNHEIDGIELAQIIRSRKLLPIIYTTAFRDKETLQRMARTGPIAYLVKPIDSTELQAAIELALCADREATRPQAPQHEGHNAAQVPFFVKTVNGIEKVSQGEILWIESGQEKYVNMVTNKKNYRIRSSLAQMESRLGEALFVRINRTHLVNLEKVERINEFERCVEVAGYPLTYGQTYLDRLVKRLNLL